jgi:hypothetical protein
MGFTILVIKTGGSQVPPASLREALRAGSVPQGTQKAVSHCPSNSNARNGLKFYDPPPVIDANTVFWIEKSPFIHYHPCMKAITINVSEPTYAAFQAFSKQQDRTTSELIREAMEEYRKCHIRSETTLEALRPQSVVKILSPLSSSDDLMEEMLHGRR